MISILPPAAVALAIVVAVTASLATASGARAALAKPTYAAGDRWVYVLQGALPGFPGLNASEGSAELGLSGLVEVDVLGPAQATVGGSSVPGVRVETHATGFLNGSFVIPGNGTLRASGTFSMDSVEVWEGQAYLPTAANSTSSYIIGVTFGITFSVSATVWVNATTSYASYPPFNLSTGQSATAPFTTDADVATTFSFLTFGNHTENRTSFAGTWDRQVLGVGNVTVEAGTFSAYRLNESLGSFPGLGIAVTSGGANASAWFSDDVGYYVERQAYLNGTPVAEMRLKSYTYPAAPPGLSLLDVTLLAAIPIAAVALLVLLVLRRRRRKPPAPSTSGSAGPVGELPPKPPGGGP